MKKVRIMLMALLVIAAVGGTLAFKAKSTELHCGTSVTSCPNFQLLAAYTFTTGTAFPNWFCTDGTNTTICKPVTLEQ